MKEYRRWAQQNATWDTDLDDPQSLAGKYDAQLSRAIQFMEKHHTYMQVVTHKAASLNEVKKAKGGKAKATSDGDEKLQKSVALVEQYHQSERERTSSLGFKGYSDSSNKQHVLEHGNGLSLSELPPSTKHPREDFELTEDSGV